MTDRDGADSGRPLTGPEVEANSADIERRAYEIWEREGRPDGRSAEHWEAAQAELRRPPAARQLHNQDTALGPDDALPIGRGDDSSASRSNSS